MAAHLRLVKDEISIDTLRKFNLIYLASPYTLYAKGLSAAFEDVTALAGKLVNSGLNIIPAITMGHPLSVYGGVSVNDLSIWYRLNDAVLRKCDCLLVARLPGHQSSKGVQREIAYSEKVGMPVFFIHPDTLEVF